MWDDFDFVVPVAVAVCLLARAIVVVVIIVRTFGPFWRVPHMYQIIILVAPISPISRTRTPKPFILIKKEHIGLTFSSFKSNKKMCVWLRTLAIHVLSPIDDSIRLKNNTHTTFLSLSVVISHFIDNSEHAQNSLAAIKSHLWDGFSFVRWSIVKYHHPPLHFYWLSASSQKKFRTFFSFHLPSQ